MNLLRLVSPLLFTLSASFALAAEGTTTPPAAAPAATAPKPSGAERRAASLLKELKIADAAKEAKVRGILESHFTAMEKWHATHDSEVAPLWSEWASLRSPPKKDEAAAAKTGEKIDAVYASFRPQHDAFLAALAKEISADDINKIKNTLTRSPGMDRTANAYFEMVPQFTDADKAFVREHLALAREQAIDTTADKEVVNFFKRQKVIIEAYIDEKGYDYRKSYEAWIAKSKATADAAKAEKAAKATGAKKE